MLTQAVSPLARRMVHALEALGLPPTISMPAPREGERQCLYMRPPKSQWLADWLVRECGEGTIHKRIPALVWTLSSHHQNFVFEAMMEGDGRWHAEGAKRTVRFTGTYYTCSPALASDMQRLAILLGYSASIRTEPGAKPNHSDRWYVNIGSRTAVGVTARHGHHSTQQYKGKVYCFTVPSGAYLTRRNGKMAITGNSVQFDAAADLAIRMYSDVNNVDSSVSSLGIVLKITKTNDTGWGKERLIVLDFTETGLHAAYHGSELGFPALMERVRGGG